MTQYQTLFSSFRIGNLVVTNRIVMPAMGTSFGDSDGSVNDRHIAYYVRRANGGVGYITSENSIVLKQGRGSPKSLLIDRDDKIPSFSKLAKAIHEAGSKLVIQLNHTGRQTSASVTGSPIVAPSAIPCPVRKGSRSDGSMAEALKGKAPEIYVIGDASKPREMMEALYDGAEVAYKS